ncbi:ParB/RepB/Spo0J family partition protein [Arenimonas oryziterrae]|uniref:ParB-like N-terminal domain-containing protein n=1 Tax=Arenimonas oryziterrae DSM 21050 = YC6267 TaxID=1121015 RepID=A0A091ASH2_9GAMM|nr:ParB/RepB/Spo0J family partition protein [Arenimonas oryziterrae]KFN42316.1 hypothetical protein N789_14075 [Arenimonas oryziterrae DSM 21050 = YC6267]
MNLTTLPLSALQPSPQNVRKTGGKSIPELAANIRAVGLMHNLVVRTGIDGKYEVVDGSRRVAALRVLIEQDHLPASYEAPCAIMAANTDERATEASLSTFIMREALHPADQFEAFRDLVERGTSIADVAAHFGVTELFVKQRLKLANVSPRLFDLYRQGGMDLEQLQALALTDDHEAQENVWDKTTHRHEREPMELRRRLTSAEVRANSELAVFVGLDAYVAAGGAVRKDLFSTNDDAYLTDPKLLRELAQQKLALVAAAVEKEGWSWVEAHLTLDHSQLYEYQAHPSRPIVTKPSKEVTDRKKAIAARLEQIHQEVGDLEQVEEWDEEAIDALRHEEDTLKLEVERLDRDLEKWSDKAKTEAGALVFLSHFGLQVHRGRLRPGQQAKGDKVTGTPKADKPAAPKKTELGEPMIRRLSAHRTLALQALVSTNVDVALPLLIHAMANRLLFNNSGGSALHINPTNSFESHDLHIRAGAKDLADGVAWKAMKAGVDVWLKKGLPKNSDAMREWIFKQSRDTQLQLLAFLTALTLEAGHGKNGRVPAADAIAGILKLDMAKYWQPTPDTFLAQVPKALVIEAIKETCGKADADKLSDAKRDEVIASAGKLLQGKGWLPKVLRGPNYGAKPQLAAPAPKSAKAPAAKKAPAKKAKTAVKKKPAKK